jgi:hypothetical protein
MPKSFNFGAAAGLGARWREPKFIVRAILGVLLGANLVAAGLLLFPPGGSSEDLDRQLTSLQAQVQTQRARLDATRAHAAAIEKGRVEGDSFLDDYFLPRRTATSHLVSVLEKAAAGSHVKSREGAISMEPVEGSDTLYMWTITATYEGTYQELLHLVHEIDSAPGLLVIESLNAAPQQGGKNLSVAMKIQTFVRDDGKAFGSGEEPAEAHVEPPLERHAGTP